MRNRGRGFTLAELLITVVIMAVIASMIIPRFLDQRERAVVAEAISILTAIRQAEASYYRDNLVYTATLTDLDIDIPSSTKFSYDFDVNNKYASAHRLPDNGPPYCTGSGATPYAMCNIVLTMDGYWAGEHPFRPNN